MFGELTASATAVGSDRREIFCQEEQAVTFQASSVGESGESPAPAKVSEDGSVTSRRQGN